MEKIVAFFSNESELRLLERRHDFERIILIALTPSADYSLQYNYPKRRKTIEDYYDEKVLNQIGNDSCRTIKQLCSRLDNAYFSGNNKFSCEDIYMYIKLLYDQILINHTFCKAIHTLEKPSKVIIFNYDYFQNELLVDAHDDLMLNCINYYFLNNKKVVVEQILKMSPPKTQRKFGYIDFFKKNASVVKIAIVNCAYRIFNFNQAAVYILQAHDFELVNSLKKDFKVYFVSREEKRIKNTQFIKDELSHFFQEFEIDNIDYNKLLKDKMCYLVNILAPKFIALVEKFRNHFKKLKIRAVLAASGQSIEVLAGIKAAYLEKIPVFWGQHGGFYGYAHFPILNTLCKYYSHYIFYAPGCNFIKNKKKSIILPDSKLLSLFRIKRKKFVN